ncbi:MAG: Do family serine endopeptidase [Ignavibacteria bacterium]|nr:Do family serine endopeptidase [Ignavibacteria bacterium]
MEKQKVIKILAISVGGLAVLVGLYFAFFKGQIFAQQDIGASKPPIEINPTIKALNEAFTATANAVIPSVVNIRVKIKQKISRDLPVIPFEEDERFPFFKDWNDFFRRHFQDLEPDVTSAGSGVFVTSDGYIVTNNHVVEKADEIIVLTHEKKEYKARIIGTDKWTDLAVIKIDGEGFKPVHFANLEDVQVGELVVAVGNPLGLSSTVTFGIISAKGRGGLSVIRPNVGEKGNFAIENFIQTDAPINPGNSGGGLFTLNGSLVGINTAIATRTGTYIGYGFAIPVDLVKTVVTEIIRKGKFDRAYLGVYIRSIDETYAKALGLKKIKGAFVNEIEPNSPAEKAGIQVEDVILAVDGKEINSSNELQVEIAKRRPGETVELTIWRNRKEIKLKVKLASRERGELVEERNTDFIEPRPGQSVTIDKLGIVVSPLDDKLKEQFEVSNGVYLKEVKDRSLIDERGLSPNGVITKVDNIEIRSVKDLNKALENKKPGDAVLLRVKYKNSTNIIAVEIPESKEKREN